MENKDLSERLLEKEGKIEETQKREEMIITVTEAPIESEQNLYIESPAYLNKEENTDNRRNFENSSKNLIIVVEDADCNSSIGQASPQSSEITVHSKHLMFFFVAILILVNIFTTSILYGRSSIKINAKYFAALFFISYFFFLLTIMGSILLLVYPRKYLRYFSLKIEILAYFFVLCFYVTAGIDVSISEMAQLFINQLYVARLFIMGLLLIVTFAFDTSMGKAGFFGVFFAGLESFYFIDPLENYYRYVLRTVIFLIANINFIVLIKNYNIFRNSKVPKNRFIFFVFSLSLSSNGEILNFIYNLSLYLLIGKYN